MYGIANCDTIKKAKLWLEKNAIEFVFYDYKKQVPSEAFLIEAIQKFGLDTVVNKRGTSYRKLDDNVKNNLNEHNAIGLLQANCSMIKRPIIKHNGQLIIGFNDKDYKEFFGLE